MYSTSIPEVHIRQGVPETALFVPIIIIIIIIMVIVKRKKIIPTIIITMTLNTQVCGHAILVHISLVNLALKNI